MDVLHPCGYIVILQFVGCHFDFLYGGGHLAFKFGLDDFSTRDAVAKLGRNLEVVKIRKLLTFSMSMLFLLMLGFVIGRCKFPKLVSSRTHLRRC